MVRFQLPELGKAVGAFAPRNWYIDTSQGLSGYESLRSVLALHGLKLVELSTEQDGEGAEDYGTKTTIFWKHLGVAERFDSGTRIMRG